jgi:Flp pilus assembly protein TadD
VRSHDGLFVLRPRSHSEREHREENGRSERVPHGAAAWQRARALATSDRAGPERILTRKPLANTLAAHRMQRGFTKRRLLVRDEDPPATEDFLFHLSRGSEMLMQNRVVEAKEELERALDFRPQDAQGQDLLAGVYFRLGVYPTAIRLWKALVDEFPDDHVLHVNLGLALFKTGQPEDARAHLERALAIDPEHDRAWGYLGLTLWRLGKLDEARAAFLRGGQISMAERMEEQSASLTPPPPSAPPSAPPNVDAQVSAVRDAATEAEHRLSASRIELSLEHERPVAPGGPWKVVETGADPIPHGSPARATPTLTPQTIAAVTQSWTAQLPEDGVLAVGGEGELLVQSQGSVHVRLSGLRAVRAPLRSDPVMRRYRGRTKDADEIMGGSDPILRWQGPAQAVLTPPDGLHFHAFRIDGALLYVREELVQGFDDRVGYESGRLPLAGEPVVLLSFYGDGTVVLRLPRRPTGLEVRADEEVHVDPAALVGWTGRLFPSEVSAPEPSTTPLALRGQGIVLLT